MAIRTNKPPAKARRSRLGQNFLADYDIAKRIAAAAQLTDDDHVLEIGPGKGALTRILVHRARRLIAVELDPDLCAFLSQRFSDSQNLLVVNQDALDFDPAEYFSTPYKVVANLPYYAATPIIRKLLSANPRPSSLLVMVQKEVALNIAASPGGMTLLSVMVQLYATPKILFSVPPRAFRPMPKVTSALLRIDLHDSPSLPVASPDSFIEFAAAGFRAPRKQISNSLKLGLNAHPDPIRAALDAAQIDSSRRPATLSLPEWITLYQAWNQITHT